MDNRIWIETIARLLANCRERGIISNADQVARIFQNELDNVNLGTEFRRVYSSYARTKGGR
jgi:hypothetical protein